MRPGMEEVARRLDEVAGVVATAPSPVTSPVLTAAEADPAATAPSPATDSDASAPAAAAPATESVSAEPMSSEKEASI